MFVDVLKPRIPQPQNGALRDNVAYACSCKSAKSKEKQNFTLIGYLKAIEFDSADKNLINSIERVCSLA